MKLAVRVRSLHIELLAIGAGPSNLALAVALEELAPDELARNALVIEQHDTIARQHGMLLPWTRSQVSFLKDLVTPRNPRSKLSFINYPQAIGRLNDFINLGTFTPYRRQLSGYLQWLAQSLTKVRVEYGRRCTDVVPSQDADGWTVGWTVDFADGSTISCRYLVIGCRRDANVPAVLANVPHDRLIHSSEYCTGVAPLDPALPYRIAVIGGAQSAAEMLWATHEQLPNAEHDGDALGRIVHLRKQQIRQRAVLPQLPARVLRGSRELLAAANEFDHGFGYDVRVLHGYTVPQADALVDALGRATSVATFSTCSGHCDQRAAERPRKSA
jgi:lysine/ornithine N-monooxygenase